ncbi:MAG: porin family protein [Rhodoblastus sp.]|nr:MAG: porin family protein [Rhodoblastus sp.]
MPRGRERPRSRSVAARAGAGPAAEPLVEWGSGWYLRGDMNVSDYKLDPLMRLPGVVDGGGKRRTGFGGDLGMGYQFNDTFRADATIGLGAAVKQKLSTSYGCINTSTGIHNLCTETATTTISRYPMLANAYIDLGAVGGLRPYVGAGAGVALIREKWDRKAKFEDGSPMQYSNAPAIYGLSPNTGSKTRTNFAFALMGGVAYDLADGVTLDIGYRYLDMGQVKVPNAGSNVGGKLREHQARIGLRYRID